jgi:PAS domain S-box-containing protein
MNDYKIHIKNTPLEHLLKETVNQGIIEAIGDALSIQDTDFKILYQNERAIKMIGNHIGEYCYKAYEKRDSVCENCSLALSFNDGKVRTVERRNPAKRELTVEITSSVIKNSTGKIIAGIEVVRNISKRKRLEEERERLVTQLKTAIANVKTLKGLLPVCSCCNKIRDDNDQWTKVDVYIRDHSNAEITHSYCPECVSKVFPTNQDKVHRNP